MKVLVLINFTIIFLVALIFSVLNFHSVQINLYFTSVTLPLAVIMILELVAGILIGFLAMLMRVIKIKAQYARANKKAI